MNGARLHRKSRVDRSIATVGSRYSHGDVAVPATAGGTDMMDYFGLDEQVSALEEQLDKVAGIERLAVLVPLAWYLRQRDTQRALAIVEEARALVHEAREHDPVERARIRARLTRIVAEEKMLLAQFDAANVLAGQARQSFEAIGDRVGVGDTHALEAQIAAQRGGAPQCEIQFLQAAHDA